jgi:predicted nucleic acid-binding protein
VPFLIDTDVAIHLRDRDAVVMGKVRALTGPILLSIISRVELESGVYREPKLAPIRRAELGIVLLATAILPFDEPAVAVYGSIVAAAGYSRRKLLHRMIAAQALVHDLILITMNAGDFQDVPNLKLIGW